MREISLAGITTETNIVLSGRDIFALKDTAGFPLAMSFIECEKRGLMIDWIGIIEAARDHGWWDYQTFEMIEEAFVDSGAWPDKREAIILRIKQYILSHPHA